MTRTGSPFCPNCRLHYCKRVYERLTVMVGRKDNFKKRFSQHMDGIGWKCEKCGLIFSDAQAEKSRAKLFSEKYSAKVRDHFSDADQFLLNSRW